MITINKKRRTSIIWKIEKEELIRIIDNSDSLRDVLEILGLSRTSAGQFQTLKKRLAEDNIDISELNQRRLYKNNMILQSSNKKTPLSEILTANSSYSRYYLKKRLTEEGLLKNKCDECGLNGIWNGKPINLQLEHKNGINNDNRLGNLRLLCPNCHSQTPTFGVGNAKKKTNKKTSCIKCNNPISSRNKTKMCISCFNKTKNTTANKENSNRPSKEELARLIFEKSFVQIGNIYSVSDNAVRKWCKFYNLPYRKNDIQNFNFEEILNNKHQCEKCEKEIKKYSNSGLCNSCTNKLNAKVQNRPSKVELAQLILTKPFLQIGKDYGASDNAVRKWCKAYDLPYRKKDIQAQREHLESLTQKELVLT